MTIHNEIAAIKTPTRSGLGADRTEQKGGKMRLIIVSAAGGRRRRAAAGSLKRRDIAVGVFAVMVR